MKTYNLCRRYIFISSLLFTEIVATPTNLLAVDIAKDPSGVLVDSLWLFSPKIPSEGFTLNNDSLPISGLIKTHKRKGPVEVKIRNNKGHDIGTKFVESEFDEMTMFHLEDSIINLNPIPRSYTPLTSQEIPHFWVKNDQGVFQQIPTQEITKRKPVILLYVESGSGQKELWGFLGWEGQLRKIDNNEINSVIIRNALSTELRKKSIRNKEQLKKYFNQAEGNLSSQVEITDSNFSNEDLINLVAANPQIAVLHLNTASDSMIGEFRDLTDITPLTHLTNLTELDLRGCTSIQSFASLKNLPKLTKLGLKHCTVTDKDLKDLPQSLVELDLYGCNNIGTKNYNPTLLTRKGFGSLLDLPHLKQLTTPIGIDLAGEKTIRHYIETGELVTPLRD